MKTHLSIIALILTAAWVCGCNKTSRPAPATGNAVAQGAAGGADSAAAAQPSASTSDSEAVRQAIEAHLRDNKGINMAAMDMAVSNVQVHGDQAQADAEFRLKQGGATMQMTYFLERRGGGWLVLRNQPGGGQFQPPRMDKSQSGAAANPRSPSLPDVGAFLKNRPAPGKQ